MPLAKRNSAFATACCLATSRASRIACAGRNGCRRGRVLTTRSACSSCSSSDGTNARIMAELTSAQAPRNKKQNGSVKRADMADTSSIMSADALKVALLRPMTDPCEKLKDPAVSQLLFVQHNCLLRSPDTFPNATQSRTAQASSAARSSRPGASRRTTASANSAN